MWWGGELGHTGCGGAGSWDILDVVGRGVGTYWMCKSLLCHSRTLVTAKVVLREGSSLARGAGDS